VATKLNLLKNYKSSYLKKKIGAALLPKFYRKKNCQKFNMEIFLASSSRILKGKKKIINIVVSKKSKWPLNLRWKMEDGKNYKSSFFNNVTNWNIKRNSIEPIVTDCLL
jgi:hypothetical protein